MMTHCADPRSTPEVLMLREEMRSWRFYDQFRTDAMALARLIARASRQTQVIVVSHAATLVDALQQLPECHSIMLNKQFGETQATLGGEPERVRWQWPTR